MNIDTASIAEKIKILFLILIIATVSLGFYVLQGKEVNLVIDGEEQKIVTTSETVKDLLEREDVDVNEDTFVSLPLSQKIEKNLDIVVRYKKSYILKDGVDTLEISSYYNKVSDILKEQHISLGDKDFTYPELDDSLAPNETLRIYRVKNETLITDEPIHFEKEVRKNNNLDIGTVNVIQEGKQGLKKTHLKKEYLNGVEISNEILSQEVITEPVNHIIEKGTREVVNTSRGNLRFRNTMTMRASAYDNSPQSQGRWVGRTATGMKPQRGVVAVDPKVIPLGTKLYIESLDNTKDYGFAVAGDTGGAIKGNRIDLFHNTRQECYNFGRRNVKVYILD